MTERKFVSDKWDYNEGDAEHGTSSQGTGNRSGGQLEAPLDPSERRWRPQSGLPTTQATIILLRKEVPYKP